MSEETKPVGFAAMDPARQREIASMGGKAVPAHKRTFASRPGLAAEAGRKGGLAVAPELRGFARDHALAALAGRRGRASQAKGSPNE